MLRNFCIAVLAGVLCATAFASEDISKVNGSIRVDSGDTVGALDTVNGSIHLGDNAQATDLETVNGSIEIGDGASAESADTVNGRITLGARTRISKSIDSVNGSLVLGEGSDVTGRLRTSTARSADCGACRRRHRDGQRRHRGRRGLTRRRWHPRRQAELRLVSGPGKPPRVVIGPRAVVQGTLDFRRDVELLISESAQVGTIKGATATRFPGEQP